MGANTIEMEVCGAIAENKLQDVLRMRQDDDRDRNGHKDGYSGDFQTVEEVDVCCRIFDDREEAFEFCIDRAQKWLTVVAVKVKGTPNNLFKPWQNEKYEESDCYWLIAGWGAC